MIAQSSDYQEIVAKGTNVPFIGVRETHALFTSTKGTIAPLAAITCPLLQVVM